MSRSIIKIAGAASGMTLACMLIVGSFAGALHQPSPHRLPVAVVAPADQAVGLSAALGRQAAGAFDVQRYGTENAARQAIMKRDVDAALVLGAGRQRLLTAGAAGRFVTGAVTAAFQAEAAAAGQQLSVQDVRPLPRGDENGISPLFLFIGLALPSIAFGIVLTGAIGGQLGVTARLSALAGFAVLTGLAAAWVVDGMVGALIGAPLGLAGIGALTAFALAAASAAAWRLAGPPLAVLTALLLVPVGVPAAGGPLGASFVTRWYADLGGALPAGAALPAVRNIVYFDGNALTGPLLVLCLWAGIAAVAVALPRPPLPWHRARSAQTQAQPG